MINAENQVQTGEKGAWLSIVVYIMLAILKILVGSIANSEALVADGFNNSSDFMVSLAV